MQLCILEEKEISPIIQKQLNIITSELIQETFRENENNFHHHCNSLILYYYFPKSQNWNHFFEQSLSLSFEVLEEKNSSLNYSKAHHNEYNN